MKKYCVPCYRKPHQKSKRSHKLLLLHIYFPHMPISLSSFVFCAKIAMPLILLHRLWQKTLSALIYYLKLFANQLQSPAIWFIWFRPDSEVAQLSATTLIYVYSIVKCFSNALFYCSVLYSIYSMMASTATHQRSSISTNLLITGSSI